MKTTQRNGKIARLPRAVREELNQRIEDGELGERILGWLNEVPEVKTIVVEEWEGREISEQNLSAWRNGGYRDWVEQRQAMELAVRLGENAGELKDSTQPLAETLSIWAAARLMVSTRRVAEAEGDEGWRLLREFCAEVAKVRRGDHNLERVRIERERMQLEREQLEFARERKRKETEEERWAWARENREKICKEYGGYVSQADKIAFIRRAYFADVAHPVNAAEVAVGIAMTDLRPTDPGFGRRVAEIFARGLLDGDGAPAMISFLREILEQDEEGVAAGVNGSGAVATEAATQSNQGGSRLIKVGEAEGSTRRLEDSKGEEVGAPPRRQDAKGEKAEVGDSFDGALGGSSLIKVGEEGSTRRLEDSKGEGLGEPPRRQDAKGEMTGDPFDVARGGSRLIKVNGEAGARADGGAVAPPNDETTNVSADVPVMHS